MGNDQDSLIEQETMIGEKTAIAVSMNFPDVSEDIQRLTQIDERVKKLGSQVSGNLSMTTEQQLDWLTPKEDHRIYVVTGPAKLNSSENLNVKKEVGQIHGWISVDSTKDERARAQRGIPSKLDSKTVKYPFFRQSF